MAVKATKGFALLKRVVNNDILQEVDTTKPTKGVIVDADGYKPGQIVHYIPHSELEIQTEEGPYYVVPSRDIVALEGNPTEPGSD